MNRSNLNALGLVGAVERKGIAAGGGPLEKRPGEGVDGDAPGVEPQAAVGQPRGGEFRRQVAVFDHVMPTAVADDDTDPLSRFLLRHDLRRELGAGEQVIPDEFLRQRHGQRVVDLKAHEVVGPLSGEPVEPTGPCQRHEHAAVAVGRERQAAGGVEEHAAVGGVERGQVVLPEDEYPVGRKTAPVVRGEKVPRVGVGRGTRHDRQRHVATMAAPDRHELAQQQFEERGLRDGADATEPLGALASQPAALASGDENRTDRSLRERRTAPPQGIAPGDRALAADPQAGRGDGRFEIEGERGGRGAVRRQPPHHVEQIPIDRLEFLQEPGLRLLVEPIPEGEQVLLVRTGEGRLQGRWGDHPRTHLQNSRHKSGKPPKITA